MKKISRVLFLSVVLISNPAIAGNVDHLNSVSAIDFFRGVNGDACSYREGCDYVKKNPLDLIDYGMIYCGLRREHSLLTVQAIQEDVFQSKNYPLWQRVTIRSIGSNAEKFLCPPRS